MSISKTRWSHNQQHFASHNSSPCFSLTSVPLFIFVIVYSFLCPFVKLAFPILWFELPEVGVFVKPLPDHPPKAALSAWASGVATGRDVVVVCHCSISILNCATINLPYSESSYMWLFSHLQARLIIVRSAHFAPAIKASLSPYTKSSSWRCA